MSLLKERFLWSIKPKEQVTIQLEHIVVKRKEEGVLEIHRKIWKDIC